MKKTTKKTVKIKHMLELEIDMEGKSEFKIKTHNLTVTGVSGTWFDKDGILGKIKGQFEHVLREME